MAPELHPTEPAWSTYTPLLNAASSGVSFPRTSEDVIQRFNAVHSGTKSELKQLKDWFRAHNTLGCR